MVQDVRGALCPCSHLPLLQRRTRDDETAVLTSAVVILGVFSFGRPHNRQGRSRVGYSRDGTRGLQPRGRDVGCPVLQGDEGTTAHLHRILKRRGLVVSGRL